MLPGLMTVYSPDARVQLSHGANLVDFVHKCGQHQDAQGSIGQPIRPIMTDSPIITTLLGRDRATTFLTSGTLVVL